MGKKPLQLGDLVRLDGLEKPGEDVVKVELGGADVKPEGVEQLGERMSNLAERIEGNENVTVSAVVDLVKAVNNALKHELLPEIVEKLLRTLRGRFEDRDNMKRRHPGIRWEDVQKKLEVSSDKLWSLNEMDKTKGEPDVVGYENGEFIFMDCSAESPKGRRNCVYDMEGGVELKKRNPSTNYKSNAVSLAALMGVDILTEEQYRELQTKGEFDKNTWNWIKTPVDKRESGVALCGGRVRDAVFVRERNPSYPGESGAFRCSLRV